MGFPMGQIARKMYALKQKRPCWATLPLEPRQPSFRNFQDPAKNVNARASEIRTTTPVVGALAAESERVDSSTYLLSALVSRRTHRVTAALGTLRTFNSRPLGDHVPQRTCLRRKEAEISHQESALLPRTTRGRLHSRALRTQFTLSRSLHLPKGARHN